MFEYFDMSGPVVFYNLSLLLETAQTENAEENEEPFVAPPGLNVPSDVELVCVYT